MMSEPQPIPDGRSPLVDFYREKWPELMQWIGAQSPTAARLLHNSFPFDADTNGLRVLVSPDVFPEIYANRNTGTWLVVQINQFGGIHNNSMPVTFQPIFTAG
jgi:hypothetical protein